jgi:hypothetical protein
MVAALLAVATPAALAQVTYQVNVDTLLDMVDVKVEHVAQPSMLVVNLRNTGEARARCEIVFDAAPQIPQRNTRFVNPGRTSSVVLRAQRTWFSVNVDVRCSAAPR